MDFQATHCSIPPMATSYRNRSRTKSESRDSLVKPEIQKHAGLTDSYFNQSLTDDSILNTEIHKKEHFKPLKNG